MPIITPRPRGKLDSALLGAVFFAGLVLAGPVKAGSDVAPRTHTVIIKAFKFSPKTLSVRVGDTIIWKNKDTAPHTATTKSWDTGELTKGQSAGVTFSRQGTITYICRFHPSMKGVIVVEGQ